MPTIAELSVLFTGNTSSFDAANRRVQAGLTATDDAASSATREVNAVGTAIDRLAGILTRVTGRVATFTGELRGLASSAARLGRSMDPTAVAAYAAALANMSGVTGVLSADVVGLRADMQALNRTFNSQAPVTFSGRMGSSSMAMAQLQADLAAAQAQLAQFNGTLAQTRALNPRVSVSGGGGGGNGVGKGALGSAGMMVGRTLSHNLTTPILAVGAAAVYAETQFEAAIAKIQALSGVSKEQAQRWADAIIKLGPEIGKAPTELAQGMFYVANEFKDGAKAMDILTSAGKMSAIGMGRTAEIAKALVYILHDYEGSNLTAARSSEVLVAATRVGNFDVEKLAGNLGKLLPVASHMRVPFEQVAGAIAVMTREGASVAQASTGITRLFASLEHPAAGVQKALDKVHLSAAGLRFEMQHDLLAALVHVQQATKGSDEAFSKIFPNLLSFKGVLAILGSDLKDSRKQFNEVAKSGCSMAKAFGVTSQTELFQFQKALAALEAAGIRLGASLAPEATMVANAISGLATAFSHLSPEGQRTVAVVALLLAGLGPLTTGFGLANKASVFFTASLVRMGYSAGGAAAGGINTLRLGILRLTASLAVYGAVAVAFGYGWNRMLTSMTAENNQLVDAQNRLLRQPFEPMVEAQFIATRRRQEQEAARKDSRNWRALPHVPGQNYKGPQSEFVPPGGASIESIKADYERLKGLRYTQAMDKMNADIARIRRVQAAEEKKALAEAAKNAPKGRAPKLTPDQKAEAKETRDLTNKLLELASAVRLHGDESAAAAIKDSLLYGELANASGKVAGLGVALRQLSLAQKNSAAESLYGKKFGALGKDQQVEAEILALTRLDSARKNSAKSAKSYSDELDRLNEELVRNRAQVMALKATTDEDRVSYEQFQKPYSALTDDAHRKWVQAMATVDKNKQAASVNPGDAQWDTEPNPQDARDTMTKDVQDARVKVLIEKATTDEDAISLERYGKALKNLSDPAIVAGVRELAKLRKDLQAAKVDTSSVEFSDGSDVASSRARKYLDEYRSAMHALTSEKNVGKAATDAARFAENQYGLSLEELARLTGDERAQLKKMSDEQALQVMRMQKYVEQLKAFKAQVEQISTMGSSLITNATQHVFEHGFKGLWNSVRNDLKRQIQDALLELERSKLKGLFTGALDKNKPKAPSGLAENTSAVGVLTQSINALIKQLGGTPPTGSVLGSSGIGAAAGIAAGLPGVTGPQGSALSSAVGLMRFIPGFAGGGDYYGGPMWVGESGPEILNPRGSGTVIPNSAFGGAVHNETHLHVTYNGASNADFNSKTALQHARQLHRHLKAAQASG